MNKLQHAVLTWLANGETGLSSETMAFWAAFGIKKERSRHPSDPADFNRCLKLLADAPELRLHLGKMRELSKEWSNLVDRWSEIEALFLSEVGLDWSKGRRLEARRTYGLMKEVMGEKSAATCNV